MDMRKGPTGSMSFETFYDTSMPRRSVTAYQTSRAKRSFDHQGSRIAATVIVEENPGDERITNLMLTAPMDKAVLESVFPGSQKYFRGCVDFTTYGDNERIALSAALKWMAEKINPHGIESRDKAVSGEENTLPGYLFE